MIKNWDKYNSLIEEYTLNELFLSIHKENSDNGRIEVDDDFLSVYLICPFKKRVNFEIKFGLNKSTNYYSLYIGTNAIIINFEFYDKLDEFKMEIKSYLIKSIQTTNYFASEILVSQDYLIESNVEGIEYFIFKDKFISLPFWKRFGLTRQSQTFKSWIG